jgi:WD40 repeat protein
MGIMAFSADGSMLAVAHSTREVRLIDPATGFSLATLAAPNPQIVSCLAFSPDDSRLAVANEDHTVRLWDLRQIRRQLAELNLDWYSRPPTDDSKRTEETVPPRLRLTLIAPTEPERPTPRVRSLESQQ